MSKLSRQYSDCLLVEAEHDGSGTFLAVREGTSAAGVFISYEDTRKLRKQLKHILKAQT